MSVQEHPHYPVEKQHLDETLQRIEDRLQQPVSEAGADRAANRALREQAQLSKEDLLTARPQPYFARVDWEADGSRSAETFYIGTVGLRSLKLDVYSWASPFAQALYMGEQPGTETGRTLLKRTFEITRGALQAIHDEYVDPSQAGTVVAERFTDFLLANLLRENRRGQLHDIVATIQARQYRIIRAPREELLVVQGSPGSGKTTLALHRIAYLLYNNANLKRVLVLGPNRMFMHYIAGVLPTLGERNIPQLTFDDWIMQMLGGTVEVEPQDASLEVLLDPSVEVSEKVMHYRNARNKGSLQMASLLDRYVDLLAADVLDGKESLTCTVEARVRFGNRPGAVFDFEAREERTRAQVAATLDQVHALPLNARRDAVEGVLGREMEAAIWKRLNDTLRARSLAYSLDEEETGRLRRLIADRVTTATREYFREWHAENVSVAYRRLLRTPHLLRQVGDGIFSREALELLAQDAPTARRPFRFSDLAALLYLKIRLEGTGDTRYDHIVVDEAQDLTPLHFRVLHEYNRNGAMTVLGDLAQSIYIHHGISGWEDLSVPLGGRALHTETIRESYRSTEQLVRYTNAILTRTGTPEGALPEPIPRPGKDPSTNAFRTPDELAVGVAALVRKETRDATRSVAIVCKTLAGCRALDQAFTAAGFTQYQFIQNRDTEYTGAAVLMPAYLTKGLEFDTVIIADADSQTYAPDQLNARLLYVALTRAAHTLHICWVGRRTPLLDDSVPSVRTSAPLGGQVAPRPVTLIAYTARRPARDGDWCVERLARMGKLDLLHNGMLDETVLDILFRGTGQEGRASGEDSGAQPLDAQLIARLEHHVADLESAADPTVPPALAFAQLTCGLLRHRIRAAGLPLAAEGTVPLTQQIVFLATLHRAIREERFVPGPGRWTSRARALNMVAAPRLALATEQLNLMVEYGFIEEMGKGPTARVRVPQEWLAGLLEWSLGGEPADWDRDLLGQVGRLPESLGWPSALREG